MPRRHLVQSSGRSHEPHQKEKLDFTANRRQPKTPSNDPTRSRIISRRPLALSNDILINGQYPKDVYTNSISIRAMYLLSLKSAKRRETIRFYVLQASSLCHAFQGVSFMRRDMIHLHTPFKIYSQCLRLNDLISTMIVWSGYITSCWFMPKSQPASSH